MRLLDPSSLPQGSAGATVARCSGVLPDYVVSADASGLVAARWHRFHAALSHPLRLEEHLLSYCVAGRCEGSVVLDGTEQHVAQRPGSLTFIPAHRPVQWTLDAAAGCDHVHLYIPAPALLACGPQPVRLRDAWLDSYFRLLRAEVEGLGAAGVERSPFLDDTVGLLMHRLGLLFSAGAAPVVPAACVSALQPHLLRRIQAYIEERPDGDVHLNTLASLVAMSPHHFLRAFRRATGSTPHQYVLARRLDRACALLCGSGTPVCDIARSCGFCSAAHFAALFRRYRGCTPSQFRRLH